MNIEFYGLFYPEDIGRSVPIKGDPYLAIVASATFYRTGIMIGSKELIGVQLTQENLDGIMYTLGTNSILESLGELHNLNLLDFYQCERSDEELFRIYPHLAGTHIEMTEGIETEFKNISGWNGVKQ